VADVAREKPAPHPHNGVLVVGCPDCIAVVKRDQREAAIDAAPLRLCTWTCHYALPGDDEECGPPRVLRFDLEVRVPAGWTGWDVDEEYGSLSGDAFVFALPDSVLLEWTDYACTTMEVHNVSIGTIVAEPKPAPVAMPSLFEVMR
jgi:hypothetical protein